jgi:hypothetical protein
METITIEEKSALDTYDGHGFNPQPWEIPAVTALVLLAGVWLYRTHARNKKLRAKGSELCRRSLKR